MKFPPRLKIWGQPQQIPNLSAKKITQKNFQKKILIFNAASKSLKFYYVVHYSRSRSDNFGNYYTHFQLKFFDGFHIFGILAYNIHNKILNLEQSAHLLFTYTCPSWVQEVQKSQNSELIRLLQNWNLIINMIYKDSRNVKTIKKF